MQYPSNLVRYKAVFMISISETAQAHFAKLLADQSQQTNIRVFVVNPGTSQAECGVSYCPEDAVEDNDIRLNFNGFDAVVDAESAPFLEEAEIDFVHAKRQMRLMANNKDRKRDASVSNIKMLTKLNSTLLKKSGK